MSRLEVIQHDNFIYLFAALMTMTVVGPVLAALLGDVGFFVAEASLSATLAIALWSLHSSQQVYYSGMALVVVNILAVGAWLVFDTHVAGAIAKLSGLTLSCPQQLYGGSPGLSHRSG